MSGIVAAAQSSGCCCVPMPSPGCDQVLATRYLREVEDFEDLIASFSVSSLYTESYLRDCPQYCTGASYTSQWASSGVPLSRAANNDNWRTRVPVSAGSISQVAGVCRTIARCCTRPCWDMQSNCAGETQVWAQGFCFWVCDREVTLVVRPPILFCDNDYIERTESICAGCAPSNPLTYYNQWNVRGGSMTVRAVIGFECGFSNFSQCGPNPVDGTFCRFVLSVIADGAISCPDGPRSLTSGQIRYIKRCCNYAEGPLGTYVLDPTTATGTFNDSNECVIRTRTIQASPTALVTRE
jgi:hypothetical protein